MWASLGVGMTYIIETAAFIASLFCAFVLFFDWDPGKPFEEPSSSDPRYQKDDNSGPSDVKAVMSLLVKKILAFFGWGASFQIGQAIGAFRDSAF